MTQHKIFISAPDDMTGQDVVMAIQSMLQMANEDCRDCVNHAFNDEERAEWQAKMDLYEQIGVDEQEEPSGHTGCYKHVLVQTKDGIKWLGSIPIDVDGNHMDANYGLNMWMVKQGLSDKFMAAVHTAIAKVCCGIHTIGTYVFEVQILETAEDPRCG